MADDPAVTTKPDDGFAEAFDRHAPLVLRYAQRRLEAPDAAWDVVADTFTSAWRHWTGGRTRPRYCPGSTPSPRTPCATSGAPPSVEDGSSAG